jgi:hypothetical protein
LNEDDGDRFAHWKQLRAEKLIFSLKPDLLDMANCVWWSRMPR